MIWSDGRPPPATARLKGPADSGMLRVCTV